MNAGTQGEVLAGLELKLQVVVSPMPWVLGIRLRSSARAVHALNLGVIYPALPASRHSLKKDRLLRYSAVLPGHHPPLRVKFFSLQHTVCYTALM